MKFNISILALLAGVVSCAPADKAINAAAIALETPYEVQRNPLDKREYRYTQLDNGLKVLLISDASAAKAAASMSVAVGSYQDPEGWEGLAHFCEHMLFLGTEKYPQSGEYNEYLESHGGSHNAYTASTRTNYHFSIDASAFEGALDRFSQFFVSPLFTEQYVAREKSAVHSEYFTRINNDQIRTTEAFESVINPAHPAANFNAGNLDSLRDKTGETARDALLAFYKTWYSADKMSLVMTGKESLDQLEQLARASFSAVAKRDNVPAIDYPELFVAGQLPKVIEVKPVNEVRSLNLTFPIPSQTELFRESPLAFVAELLNQQVADNWHDRLKRLGWVENISAKSGMTYGSKDSFTVNMVLTEKGVAHQDEIIAIFFDQINLIDEQGVEQWRYTEIKNLMEMGSRFTENNPNVLNYCLGLANNLNDRLPRDLIGASFKQYDEPLIRSLLADFRPDNMVVTLSTPDVETDQTTPFYGVEYRTYTPGEERVASWSQSQLSGLTLSERNAFIPESLEMVKVESADTPTRLDSTAGIELWHYPNTSYGIPKAQIKVAFDRPERVSVEQSLIQQSFFALMGQQLSDIGYSANFADLSYSLNPQGISISGYSDKLPNLLEIVLKQLINPAFSQQQFDSFKASTQRFFRNRHQNTPSRQMASDLEELLDSDSHNIEEVVDVFAGITLDKVLKAPESLYRNVRVQMLASGNITKQQAVDVANTLQSLLALSVTDKPAVKGKNIVKLEPSVERKVYLTKLAHQDAAVLRYYQGRNSSREERVYLSFLAQLVGQPYFQSLRTEQQLGYIVQANMVRHDRVPGLAFVVQSPSVSASEIEAATDRFLPAFTSLLDGMIDADFESLKQAMLAQLKQAPKNLDAEVDSLWKQLRDDYMEFDSKEQLIKIVSAVTLDDIRNTYREIVLEQPRSISVVAPGSRGGVRSTIESAGVFRKGKGVYTRM